MSKENENLNEAENSYNEFNNSYYFEMIKETDNLKVKQIFNKETLKKCIDFNE